MQTNLTFDDALLSLLLGIVGSIIATYLFASFPRWAEKLSTIWAERSRNATNAKVARLRSALDRLNYLEKNPTAFISWIVEKIARSLFFCFSALFVLICNFISKADYSLDSIMAKIGLRDMKYVWGFNDERLIAIVSNSAYIVSLFLFFVGARILSELVLMGDVPAKRASLERKIRRLEELLRTRS